MEWYKSARLPVEVSPHAEAQGGETIDVCKNVIAYIDAVGPDGDNLAFYYLQNMLDGVIIDKDKITNVMQSFSTGAVRRPIVFAYKLFCSFFNRTAFSDVRWDEVPAQSARGGLRKLTRKDYNGMQHRYDERPQRPDGFIFKDNRPLDGNTYTGHLVPKDRLRLLAQLLGTFSYKDIEYTMRPSFGSAMSLNYDLRVRDAPDTDTPNTLFLHIPLEKGGKVRSPAMFHIEDVEFTDYNGHFTGLTVSVI
jgi:hypothetical protein